MRHSFEYIVNVDNLLKSWSEFIKGKRKRKDVLEFSFNLMDNILSLHNDLSNNTYKHRSYQAFKVYDPKPRDIHKASVRDRLVHRAVYRVLYPFFEKIFISDSFSCRKEKGTHRAIKRFYDFSYKTSENNTKTIWILKCDIKKFFANIEHNKLIAILKEYIPDTKIIQLLEEIIKSFCSGSHGVGLPLGNLTSQLLANVYMNELDQFIKHKIKAKCYIRYADDFVIFSKKRQQLGYKVLEIQKFLEEELKLKLHPNKVSIKTLSSGQDFLGWVSFPNHKILRTATRKRILKRIKLRPIPETLNSYLGLLKHGNTKKIREKFYNSYLVEIS